MNQRVVALTGDDLRHRYVLWKLLHAGVNLVGVVLQSRPPDPVRKVEHAPEDQAVLDYHFGLRDQAEEAFFGHCRDLPLEAAGVPLLRVPEGHINDPEVVEFVRNCRPDAVSVYGTRLLRDEILAICPGRVVNLHLGMSPYYRGAATIFWPLYNDEPEFVGATIHQIDLTIDTGAIFHHVRPEIAADDNPHTIGCKAVQAAAEGLLRTLWEMERGEAVAVPQWDKGRLYLQRHFEPRHARELYERLAGGMLERYLERRDRVCYTMRLVG
jgi:methionyl-tRNA formyltransferase